MGLEGLSIIIVTRNEEKNIERTINSVIDLVNSINKNIEIIIVDSNSNDNTIEIIKKYMKNKLIKLFVINKESTAYMTASMGRYIGAIEAAYDNLLFIDGDMELIENWIERAFLILEKNKNIDGLVGIRDDIYVKNNSIESIRKNGNNIFKIKECDEFGGALLIKKEALIKSGNYNPFLKINEEKDLYARIKKNNFKIIEIPYKMVNHYTEDLNFKQKILKIVKSDFRNSRSLAFKEAFKSNYLFEFISLYNVFFLTITIDIISIVILLLYSNNNSIFLIIAFQFFLLLLSKRNRNFISYFFNKVFEIKFILGLFDSFSKFDIEYYDLFLDGKE
jgi:glycosyltransferase involved in cell wall biosynthesis